MSTAEQSGTMETDSVEPGKTETAAEEKDWSKLKVVGLGSATIGIVTAYASFFGYSYISNVLDASGFQGVGFEITIQEALYQAFAGFTELVGRLPTSTYKQLLSPSLLLAITVFLMTAGICINQRLGRKPTTGKRQNFIKSLLKKAPSSYWRIFGVSIFMSLGGFFFYYFVMFVFAFTISFLWIILSFGSLTGIAKGTDIVQGTICVMPSSQEWSIYNGCTEIVTKEGVALHGRIIYSDGKKLFFITDKKSFVFDSDNKILFSKSWRKDTP